MIGRTTRGFFWVLLALALANVPALADGFRMNDGRYAGGAATTLILSDEQLASPRDDGWLVLTEDQKKKLKADAGIAPSKVLLYDVRLTDPGDCTCHAVNVAFRFDEFGFDVAHQYLVSDEGAKLRQAELDALR